MCLVSYFIFLKNMLKLFLMKKFFLFTIIVLLVLGGLSYSLKQQDGIREEADIYFFYSETCSVCARAKVFLNEMEEKYPEVILSRLAISNKKTVEKLVEYYGKYEVPKDLQGMVPIIFSFDKYIVGFSEKKAVEIEAMFASGEVTEKTEVKEEKGVSLPFIGEIKEGQYSLPLMAVILGLFDGFNVCSLGALVLILGLVLVLQSRKKILIFGSIFILTTGLVYGLLIFLWYQLFLFIAPYLKIMEVLVGVLGVLGGIYFLRDFLKFKKQGPTCDASKGSLVSKMSSKVKKTLEGKKSVISIVIGILLFAVIITVAEFPCSAAVPLFFAGTLAEANLSFFSYLSYIGIFILFYMIDEIIVFLIAVFTMTVKLSSNKFVLIITLIESIVLFLLGFYYLFGFLIF